jgi:hypothetical protein
MRVYRVWFLLVIALVIFGASINLWSGIHAVIGD